jgi:hypothetical protein
MPTTAELVGICKDELLGPAPPGKCPIVATQPASEALMIDEAYQAIAQDCPLQALLALVQQGETGSKLLKIPLSSPVFSDSLERVGTW